MRHKFTRYTLLLLGIIPVVSLLVCGCEPASVQPEPVPPGPAVQWYKALGEGEGTYGNFVQQTTDGGYIVCGMLSVSQSGHVLLFKIAPEE